MVHVKVRQNGQGRNESVMIKGHADFADPGKDIVCAAVSAVSFGLINSAEKLLSGGFTVRTEENGALFCQMPGGADVRQREELQLLLDAMISTLEDIEEEYGDFISMVYHNKRR